jgi:hypothetical protein
MTEPTNRASMHRSIATSAALLLVLAAVIGPRASASGPPFPQTSEPANLNPAEFTTNITNPYFPVLPGARWLVRVTNQRGGRFLQTIKVTNRTRRMGDGVVARVVDDVVRDHGKVIEKTKDRYAQDAEGNVWYFGENTVDLSHGKKNRTGSFEAGVNGADAGVAMPAHPTVGMTYREEYFAGHAMDRSRVLSLDAQAQAPFGHFTGAVLTQDTSPLEPQVLELKIYAPGIGQVLAQTVSGGSEREELISFKR